MMVKCPLDWFGLVACTVWGGGGGGVETFGVIGINVSTLSSNVVNSLQNIFLLWIVETNIMQVICW